MTSAAATITLAELSRERLQFEKEQSQEKFEFEKQYKLKKLVILKRQAKAIEELILAINNKTVPKIL